MDCSIISTMFPISTMIIASIVLKEPIKFKKAGGVALSFAGIIFVILNNAAVSTGTVKTETVGVVLIIANSVCFSL